MILVGRLEGTVEGQSVSIVAGERGVVVEFSKLSSAWRLRRFAASAGPLLGALQHHGVALHATVGRFGTYAVLPRPSILASLIAPALRAYR